MLNIKTIALTATIFLATPLVSAAPLTEARASNPKTELESIVLEKRAPWPKRGLPFNDNQWIHNFNGKDSQVNWAYNWHSRMPDDFPSYMEFVPMLWGAADDKTQNWFDNANNALSRGSGHLLAFNEPDRCDQACLQPQQAVDAYHRFMQPFADRASLGAPAVTSQDGVGLPWLEEFLARCQGCKIDFVPVHWYGDSSHDAHFTNFINEAARIAGDRKIWVTEFAAFGSTEQQVGFLQKIIPFLDNHPSVYRYSWFWADPGSAEVSLVKWDGQPSDLGNMYTYTPYGSA